MSDTQKKRSIPNARQFGVDGRKTLFLLLLLFAIPADDCFAQTPPPPVDGHALERVSPTIKKRLATRFSLGAFAGRFEETPLGTVRDTVGEGTIQHQGDAGDSIYWLCYRRAQHRLWVVSSGEMGGPDHRVTEIVEELAEKNTEAGIAFTSISMPARAAPCFTTDWIFCTVELAAAWNRKRRRRPSLARTPSGPFT